MQLRMVAPTPLREKALAHLGIGAEEYCQAFFRRRVPRDRVLTTPPLIYQAWLGGDAAAAQLVERAADDYALAAKAMVAHTGSAGAEATFGGGVIACAPPEFWPLLAERLHRRRPAAVVKPPELPAELGAAIMAGHQLGLDPATLFRRLREANGDAKR